MTAATQRTAPPGRTADPGDHVTTPASSASAAPAPASVLPTPAADPPAPAVLWSLNGLRAGGALLVMLFHINVWNLQLIRGSGALNAAVGMFFVLSGFVLVWTARPGTTLGTFYTRRLARIVPNHLVTYALGVVLTLVVLDRTVHPGTVIAGVFLLQAWLPSPEMVFAINDVTWSLSCEIAFYVVFPALLWGLRRLRPGVRVALVGTALLIPPALTLAWPSLGTLMFHLPPARLPEFVVGMVAAMAVQGGWRPRVPAPVLLGVLGVVLLGAAAVDVIPLPVLTAVLAVVFAPLCARCAWADAEGRNGWARHPAVMLAGALSFSFYLLHELVIKVLVQTPLRGWWVVPLVLVVSTALAFVLWRTVELPGRRWVLSRLGAGSGHHRADSARHGRGGSTRWSEPVDVPVDGAGPAAPTTRSAAAVVTSVAREDPARPAAPGPSADAGPPTDPVRPAAPVPSATSPARSAAAPATPAAPTPLTAAPATPAALPPAPRRAELPGAEIPDGAVAWGVAAASAVVVAREQTLVAAPHPAPAPQQRPAPRRTPTWTAPPPPTPTPRESAPVPPQDWRPPAPPSTPA